MVVVGLFLLFWSLRSWLHIDYSGLTGPDLFTDLWSGNISNHLHSNHTSETDTTAAAAVTSQNTPSKDRTSAPQQENALLNESESTSVQGFASAGQQDSPVLKGYPKPKNLKVAVIETNGVHEEVMAALIYAFGSQPDTEIQLYKKEPRWGIQKIVDRFHLPKVGEWQRWEEFRDNGIHNPPDIMIFTTCYDDPRNLESTMHQLLNRGRTYAFCIVHKSNTWDEPVPDQDKVLRPWAEKKLLSFITLSPAVTRTIQEIGMESWPRQGDQKIERTIRNFAPVFPVTLPPLPLIEDEKEMEEKVKDWIALQGIWSPERRNFDRTFTHFQRLVNDLAGGADTDAKPDESTDELTDEEIGEEIDEDIDEKDLPPEHRKRNDLMPLNGSSIELHLIGHGEPRPVVPPKLRLQVIFHEKLLYQDFYNLLSMQTALIPAFSSDIYLWEKASSTIPAALVAGCPPIVDAETIKAYSYLTEESVYIQSEEETEFDVLKRVMQEPRAWRIEKKRQVRLRTQHIIKENALKVREWITEAKAAIGRFR